MVTLSSGLKALRDHHGYGGLNFLGYTLGKTDAGGQPQGMLAGAAIAFFSY